MTRHEFFTAVLLIVGQRPDSDGDALMQWCAHVEHLMMCKPADKVKWTHRLSSVPWRIRRGEFEQWLRREQRARA